VTIPATTITLHWRKQSLVERTYTTTVNLDDLPDDLVVPIDEEHWHIDAGQTRSAEVDAFLAGLEVGIRRAEQRIESEVRFIDIFTDVVPPPLVTAAPVTNTVSVEVAEYVAMVEDEIFTPYNADEAIDVADARRKDYA
jgi:hypothetical protein